MRDIMIIASGYATLILALSSSQEYPSTIGVALFLFISTSILLCIKIFSS